jgi:hypothetical protein
MHIALGYSYFSATTGFHLERALRDLGHVVSYVGLPAGGRSGYSQGDSLPTLLAGLTPPVDQFWWVDSGGPYFPPGLEAAPVPTVGYLIDTHVGNWRPIAARFFDLVFCAQKDNVAAYRQAVGHSQVSWLPLAAAPDVHRRLDLPPKYDVGFVGHAGPAHRRSGRARRLKRLSERYRMNDIGRFYPPEMVAQVYSQSRLVFNLSLAGDVNMRVFEGSACGALVITDAIRNGLDELFDLDHEIVLYTSDDDLVDQIDYYLAHDEERACRAQAAYERTLAHHTYAHRAHTALAALAAPGFQRLAPMRSATPQERWQARRVVYTRLLMLEAISAGARAASRNPLRRARDVLPCLLRTLLV